MNIIQFIYLNFLAVVIRSSISITFPLASILYNSSTAEPSSNKTHKHIQPQKLRDKWTKFFEKRGQILKFFDEKTKIVTKNFLGRGQTPAQEKAFIKIKSF